MGGGAGRKSVLKVREREKKRGGELKREREKKTETLPPACGRFRALETFKLSFLSFVTRASFVFKTTEAKERTRDARERGHGGDKDGCDERQCRSTTTMVLLLSHFRYCDKRENSLRSFAGPLFSTARERRVGFVSEKVEGGKS